MLTPMTSDQRRHLDALDGLWTRYAIAVRSREDFIGGMQWKGVGEAEYLTRYRPDPLTGKKVAKSLGRRSPATEKLYCDFTTHRDAVRTDLADLEPQIEMAGRIGKAVRLARLPSNLVDGLWNLWKAGLFGANVTTMLGGATALMLYETKMRMLADASDIKEEDGPSFLILDGHRLDWDFAMQFGSHFGGRKTHIETLECGSERIRVSVDGMTLTLYSRDAVESALEEMNAPPNVAECVMDATQLPPIAGYALSRDARFAPLIAPDPRAYCLLTPVLAGNDEVRRATAWSRVGAVEEIVGRYWPEKFSGDAAMVLDELREFTDPGATSPALRL